MMPDLGRYAVAVLGSYAVTLGALALLVAWVLWRASRVRRALEAIEARQPGGRRDG